MKKKGKLVVVDDNENDFLIISRYLRNDYDLIYYADPTDILHLIHHENPDCLLLDYHIGTIDGINVLKEIKGNEEIKSVPVMMLTNEKEPEVIIDCMKNGADDYLIKDRIGKERVLTSIDNIVEKGNLRKRVKTLESMLPICASCKKIRKPNSDYRRQDSWEPVEKYISDRTQSNFSHGYCPECLEKLRNEVIK